MPDYKIICGIAIIAAVITLRMEKAGLLLFLAVLSAILPCRLVLAQGGGGKCMQLHEHLYTRFIFG